MSVKGAKKPKYVQVKDLDKFQHYRDRCPPWVKLHWSLLDNPSFVALDEINRHRFIMCILLASRVGNRIINDPIYLARTMRLSEPVDLTELIHCGLLLAWRAQPASNISARSEQVASQSQSQSQRRERDRAEGGSGGEEIVFTNGAKKAMSRSMGLDHISELMPQSEQEVLKRFPHLAEVGR